MIRGVEALSFRKKKKKHRVISTIIKIFLLTFLFYLIITYFLVFPVRINSESMSPAIGIKDIVIISPLVYGPKIPFLSSRIHGIKEPERGDIVAINPPFYKNDNFFIKLMEPVVRFFTLQKKSLIRDVDNKRLSEYSAKRIIGLPGDTVKMESFVAYIKPAGAQDFVRENELIEKKYTTLVEEQYFPGRWRDIFPFSGNMEEITLQPDEFFVLGDSRSVSNDSYTWGPLDFSRIQGKIIFRYWPFTRFGIP
ncbi:MAG: signal peptidase I [Spirochaetales bacterium]|nr:signal peptidase I [Spirochaetales bacterium]